MVLLTVLTVLILYYYTKETYLLRREAQRQSQFLVTPYLSLHSKANAEVVISNIGKGIAKNARFEPAWNVKGDVQGFSLIAPAETRDVLEVVNDLLENVSTTQIPDGVQINIEFEDILKNSYRAEFRRSYSTNGRFVELFQSQIGAPKSHGFIEKTISACFSKLTAYKNNMRKVANNEQGT